MQYSIVTYKKAKETSAFRLDAEYFHPTALLYEEKINKLQGITIKEYGCKIVSGPFGSSLKSDAYLSSGIPFIRISDLKNFQIDTDQMVYITKEDHNRLSSSRLNIGDLVLSKVGNTIGIVSKITEDIGECNISENNIGIRFPKKSIDKEKTFILTFLNSRIGQSQILRSISGNAQPKLNISDIEIIKITHLSTNIIRKISLIIEKSASLITKSKYLYHQTEQILLSELGLLDWKPKHQLSFVRNYSNTKSAERFDAEYFQPIYEETIEKVTQYKWGYDLLGNMVKIKDRNFVPKDEANYRYIELANISTNGNITDFTDALGKELPTRARLKVNTGDVIVSSIEGSLSSIALINENHNNALCSTGFFVIDSEVLNSETLLVLLKSLVGQLQLKKGCSGTILTAISKGEFSKIILPKICNDIQNEIKSKIVDMYNAKALSKSLLEIAKRGVELAIEENEIEAEKWIDEELLKCQVEICI